jgi:hypothetical protein
MPRAAPRVLRAGWYIDRVILCFSQRLVLGAYTSPASRDRKGAEFH